MTVNLDVEEKLLCVRVCACVMCVCVMCVSGMTVSYISDDLFLFFSSPRYLLFLFSRPMNTSIQAPHTHTQMSQKRTNENVFNILTALTFTTAMTPPPPTPTTATCTGNIFIYKIYLLVCELLSSHPYNTSIVHVSLHLFLYSIVFFRISLNFAIL